MFLKSQKQVAISIVFLLTLLTIPGVSFSAQLSQKAKEINDNLIHTEMDIHSGAIILLNEENVIIKKDGTSRNTLHIIGKIHDKQAADDYREISLFFNAYFSQANLNFAHTIDTNGIIHSIAEDAIQIKTGPGGGGMRKSYSDMKVISFSLPALTVGSLFEFEIVFDSTPVINSRSSHAYNFHYALIGYPQGRLIRIDPHKTAILSITVPKEVDLSHINHNTSLLPEIIEDHKTKLYRWTMKDHNGLKLDSDMPHPREILPAIYATTIENWEEVNNWAYELFSNSIEDSISIRNQAQEVTKHATTEDEKIKAIYNYLQENIDYVAADFGRGGYQPHKASQVIKNRYGDCKDQTVLLISLLHAVGIKANPVLINPLPFPKTKTELPSHYFSHAIVNIPRPGEKSLWLDSTPVGDYSRLHWSNQNRWAFIIQGEGGEFQKTPHAKSGEHAGFLHFKIDFNESKSLIEMEFSGKGGVSDNLKERFLAIPSDMHNEVIHSIVKSIYPEARDVSIDFSDINDSSTPFKVTIQYWLPVIWSSISERPFEIAGGGVHAINLFSSIQNLSPPSGRKNSYQNIFPMRIVSEWEYNLPEGYTSIAALPVDVNQEYGLLNYHISTSKSESTSKIKYEINVADGTIPLSGYAQFYDDVQKSLKELNYQFTLKPKKIDQKENSLQKEVEKSPDDINGLLNLAQHYLSKAQYQQASDLLKRAVALSPNNGEAHYYLGVVKGYLSEYEEAALEFKKARKMGYRP